jgi:hypothetical protein
MVVVVAAVWMIREDIGVHPLPLGPADNEMAESNAVDVGSTPVVVVGKRPVSKKASLPVATPVKTAATSTSSSKLATTNKVPASTRVIGAKKPNNDTIDEAATAINERLVPQEAYS